MIIGYKHNNLELERETKENVGFFLSDKKGGFLFKKIKNDSRYDGWCIFKNQCIKILEDIKTEGEVLEVRNHASKIEVSKTNHKETYFLPAGFNSLILTLDSIQKMRFFFDVRPVFDVDEWGRNYKVSIEEEKIVVEFSKGNFKAYVVVTGSFETAKNISSWEKRDYSLDKRRNSFPWEWYVFEGFYVEGRKVIVTASDVLGEAIKEAEYINKNLSEIEKKGEKDFSFPAENIEDQEKRFAYMASLESINKLVMDSDPLKRVYAGIPWFCKYWSRDALVSLKGIEKINPALAKNILMVSLKSLKDGMMPNIIGGDEEFNVDGTGWLFYRIGELLEKDKFSGEEKLNICGHLEKSIKRLEESLLYDGLFFCDRSQTWMDSLKGRGAYIEIQALIKRMYDLAYTMTKKDAYLKKSRDLKENIKINFLKGGVLFDDSLGKNIRSNAFLAYYIDDSLFEKAEWENIFVKLLENLYLKWGGISSIDVNSVFFHKEYDGENGKSYHNGDSWFYINDIAAMALHSVNPEFFKSAIDSIVDASANDILWHGIEGSASEISSAIIYDPQGCLAQLWSNAMYVEMIDSLGL